VGLLGCPAEVLKLVERFEREAAAYRSGAYNETQARREFIDPLFKALGWDIDNEAGHAEAYKDVVHEDAIKVGGLTKAPDYCFRIGGTRKFFVEAKKPAVNIKDDASPAFQLRRYAWSAKLPLSVLTDFQEFAVYDCRVRPDKKGETVCSDRRESGLLRCLVGISERRRFRHLLHCAFRPRRAALALTGCRTFEWHLRWSAMRSR
jgi:predicted type IV restriction endonuclease